MSFIRKHSKTNIFWYRRAIPPRLRGHLPPVGGFSDKPGRTEFTASLKTRDPREANRRAAEIDRLVQAAINAAEAAIASPQPETQAIAAPAPQKYRPSDLEAAISRWQGNEIARQEIEIFNSPAPTNPGLVALEESSANGKRNHALREGRVSDVPGFYDAMAAALASEGIQIEPDHPALSRVGPAFAAAWLATIKARENLILGLPVHSEPEPETKAIAAPPPTSQPHTKNGGQPFLFKLDEWRRQAKLQTHQLASYTSDIRNFSEIKPRLSIADTNLSAVQDWVASMVKSDLTVKTIKRKLAAIRHYWRFLQTMAYIEAGPKLGQGVVLPRIHFDPTQERRTHFDPQEIALLWRSAMAKGDQPLADVVRIGALTGARINSICSIQPADIKMVDGIGCIHFRDKTKAGHRNVPIHPALQPAIDRLVSNAGKNRGYLFFSEGKNIRAGRAEAIRKRFSTLAHKTHDFPSTQVFHSIRKTVAHLLIHAKIEEHICSALLGHEYPGMDYGTYAGPEPWLILEAMEKALVYPPDFMTAT